MPIYRSCKCGALHELGVKCAANERRRNQDPNRKKHRTARHQQIRQAVLQRDSHQCQIRLPNCTRTATECDYITPLAHGGPMTTTNARAACKTCNSTLGATTRRTT